MSVRSHLTRPWFHPWQFKDSEDIDFFRCGDYLGILPDESSIGLVALLFECPQHVTIELCTTGAETQLPAPVIHFRNEHIELCPSRQYALSIFPCRFPFYLCPLVDHSTEVRVNLQRIAKK